MKRLLFLLLIPCISFAQKPRTYFIIRATDYNFSHTDPSFGGGLSLGIKGKYVGAGFGFDVLQIPNSSGPYAPIFFELSGFSNKRKVRPYGNLKIGYALYDNQPKYPTVYIDQKGGLFFSPGVGILLPTGRNSLLLMTSYINSTFKTSANTGYYSASSSNTTDGWAVSLGMKF